MIKDLNTDLGNQYVKEFLVGACFQIDRKAYWLRGADTASLAVDAVDLDAHVPELNRERLPISALKSFSTFRYPTLGYRQVTTEEFGPVVYHLSTTRSAHRGLRFELLKQSFLPVFHYVGFGATDVTAVRADASNLKNLFAPKFTPFVSGIKKLLTGEIAGFAVNEQLAVGVSCTRSSDREYDVYFRDRVVGQVNSKGEVQFSNKVLARTDSVRSVLK